MRIEKSLCTLGSLSLCVVYVLRKLANIFSDHVLNFYVKRIVYAHMFSTFRKKKKTASAAVQFRIDCG